MIFLKIKVKTNKLFTKLTKHIEKAKKWIKRFKQSQYIKKDYY
jgi:hypothetical protein